MNEVALLRLCYLNTVFLVAVFAFKFCTITNHKGTNSLKYADAHSCDAFSDTGNTKLYIKAAK